MTRRRAARRGAGRRPSRRATPGSRRGARRFIPFCVPMTGAAEIREVSESIRSGWLTTGPKVGRLEEGIRSMVGARHAVALNSCTAALHLALAAVGVGAGDEVITSPYTFAATGETIRYFGARPVLADIDPGTLNIDPGEVERRMTRRTKAIVPVHIAGSPCDMDALMEIAKRRRVAVVDDAAHALGTRIGRRSIGSISDLTCFSFYATKNLTTGEGGMVTTDDPRLADRVRLLSLHGLSHDAWKRYTKGGSWRYDVVDVGFKYNMTDVAAGIGLAQLARFADMQRRRRVLAERYRALLGACDALDLPAESPGTTHAWHLFIVRLRPRMLAIGRDRVMELLAQKGIGASVHFLPLHLFSYYRRTFGYRAGDYPHTERESRRAVSLPLYPGLAAADQDRVVETLSGILRRHRR